MTTRRTLLLLLASLSLIVSVVIASGPLSNENAKTKITNRPASWRRGQSPSMNQRQSRHRLEDAGDENEGDDDDDNDEVPDTPGEEEQQDDQGEEEQSELSAEKPTEPDDEDTESPKPGIDDEKKVEPEDPETPEETTNSDEEGGDNTPENGLDNGNSNTDTSDNSTHASEKPSDDASSTTSLTKEDPCSVATSCESCQAKAKALFDESSEDTCAFRTGQDDRASCQTVKKSSLGQGELDPCTATTATTGADKETSTPQTSKDNQSLVYRDQDESLSGATFGVVFLLLFVCAAYKCKDKVLSQLNTAGGSTAKTAKYHEVSMEEENDEEWGWGDDDGGTGGDVELATSFKDDNSVHKRRQTSNESLSATKTSPMFQKKSPHPAIQPKTHIPTEHHIPKLPKAVPPAPVSGSGMSLKSKTTSASPMSGVTHSTAAGPGFSLSAPTTVPSAPSSTNSTDFGHLQGMAITSLGPKRAVQSTPVKKAPTPSPDDDIFASMGLAAKPTFSNTPAPATIPTAVTSTRWNAPVSASPAPLAVTGTSFGGEDVATWDDDGDLDDLLDD